jgi:cytochrome c oxidase assembly protein subunit 15
MGERTSQGLHRFAVLTAGTTFVLLFVGGLVTSTGSGLAVPDWPLSFGQVLPRMEGGVLFEHGTGCSPPRSASSPCRWPCGRSSADPSRRPRAGTAGARRRRPPGVLGGVTVLYKLPLAVSVTHACLAEVFFCLTVTLAIVSGRDWMGPRAGARAVAPGLAVLAAATTGLVFTQIALGALVRHMGAGLAIPDFPLAFGMIVPPLVTPLITVHFAHRVGALVVALAVLATATAVLRRHRDDPALRRPAQLACALVVLQIALGAFTIWSRRAVLPTTMHLSVGAALLATCLVLALRTRRRIAMRAAAAPRSAREALADSEAGTMQGALVLPLRTTLRHSPRVIAMADHDRGRLPPGLDRRADFPRSS